MKKIIATIMSIAMSVSLAACGKPKDVSEEMYNYAESVIKAADEYMDNQISYEDAYQKIDGLYYNAEILSDEHAHISNYSKDTLAYIYIGLVCDRIYSEHAGIETYSDLLDARNNLAELLNISERD